MSFSPLEENDDESNTLLEFAHPLQFTVPPMLHQDLLQYNSDKRIKEENAALLQQKAIANSSNGNDDDEHDNVETPNEANSSSGKRSTMRTTTTTTNSYTSSSTRPSSNTTATTSTTSTTTTSGAETYSATPQVLVPKQPTLSPPPPQIVTTWERSPFFRDMVHERDHPFINWIEPPSTPLFLTPWYQKALFRQPWFVAMCSMFIPGSGHALIGQNTKAVFYMTSFYTLLFTCLSLSLLYVGLFTLPLVALVYGVIIIDAHYMSVRLFQYSHAIMQGECAYSMSTWGLSLVMDKVFVTGDMANAPEEYVNRMQELYGGDNGI